MNRQEFEANWHKIMPAVMQKWNKFTQEDVTRINGKYDPFLGHLQKKYGYSREQAETEIKNWMPAPAAGGKVESIAHCDAKCSDKKGHHEKKRKAS
jgi:uncharacterized protein YjbJ (UPF0337 family)